MKTEVRKEHGDWIVFVDDNPQFSFMYREEAEKVRNMVDALVEAKRILWANDYDEDTYVMRVVNKSLKDIGAI